jgi:DNA-binding transcriptional regulator YhcF (GntR family)
VREIVNSAWRGEVAALYRTLDVLFGKPWRELGIKNRIARDMVAISAIVIANHNQKKLTTARDIEVQLGIARQTAQRHMKKMQKVGYLAREGTGFRISDKAAKAPPAAEDFATIEACIHNASKVLGALHD